MNVRTKNLICFSILHALAITLAHADDAQDDCKVQANYALYVAQERDKGTPMKTLYDSQHGTDPQKVWARMTVSNIYGSPLVTPRRVEELYLMRCEP